jgi:predicted component of type VI protein secretion system
MARPDVRKLALAAGLLLAERGEAADAVALLCAWAVAGAHDDEALLLLTEAQRIDPRSLLAQQAFETLTAATAAPPELQAAIARFSIDVVKKLVETKSKTQQRRVQIGFNNNVRYKGAVYHIQTEDSGPPRATIVTHLFADGGRIIRSVKREYDAELTRSDLVGFVRDLMKLQQLEMALALRAGELDLAIAGGGAGVVEVKIGPPKIDLQRVASHRREKVDREGKGSEAPESERTQRSEQEGLTGIVPVFLRLHVVRCLWSGPAMYEPRGHSVLMGRNGQVSLEGEPFCHPSEARLVWREGRVWLHDEDGGSGVFLRVQKAVKLDFGDEFLVGDQLLRVDAMAEPDDQPGPGPTFFCGSPRQRAFFRVTQQLEQGGDGRSILARAATMTIGSKQADFVIDNDRLVSETHCTLTEAEGGVMLVDLGSRSGVFVRIMGAQELVSGDEIVIGRTRLQLEVVEGAA